MSSSVGFKYTDPSNGKTTFFPTAEARQKYIDDNKITTKIITHDDSFNVNNQGQLTGGGTATVTTTTEDSEGNVINQNTSTNTATGGGRSDPFASIKGKYGVNQTDINSALNTLYGDSEGGTQKLIELRDKGLIDTGAIDAIINRTKTATAGQVSIESGTLGQTLTQGIASRFGEILEKTGGDIDKARSSISTTLTKNGRSATEQDLDNIIALYNEQNKIADQSQEIDLGPEELPLDQSLDSIEAPESDPTAEDINATNTQIDFIRDTGERTKEFLTEAYTPVLGSIETIRAANAEAAQVIEETTAARTAQVDQMFQRAYAVVEDLEAQAEEIFDQRLQQSVRAAARTLADSGGLVGSQVSTSTGLFLGRYRAEADLQRAELLKEASEQRRQLIQEETAIKDQILGQAALDAQAKADAIANVEQLYGSFLESYATNMISVDNAINNQISAAFANQVQLEVNEATAEVNKDMADEAKAELIADANSNPVDRIEYVQSKMPQTLTPYAANIIKTMQDNGTLMTLTLEEVLTAVSAAAYQEYISQLN